MSLNDRLTDDLKVAMRAKDAGRVSCLRMLKAAIKNEQVERGRELSDEEVQGIISSLVRKGNEAIKEFREGGREDLAAKEEQELKIFYSYLPEQMASEEVENGLKDIINELSASTMKDLGKVMKAAMARFAGRAQGKEINEIARKLLG